MSFTIGVREDADTLPERHVRYLRKVLAMMLNEFGRHDTVRMLKWALRVMATATD